MKNIALFVTALLFATAGFAGTNTLTKTQRTTTRTLKSSSVIIYGGEDVAPRHELAASTVSV